MFGKTMEEIYTMIGSPGWWFAAVIVALLVNIISNFVYDIIKPYLQSLTAQSLLWALVGSARISIFFIVSIFQSSNLVREKHVTNFWCRRAIRNVC